VESPYKRIAFAKFCKFTANPQRIESIANRFAIHSSWNRHQIRKSVRAAYTFSLKTRRSRRWFSLSAKNKRKERYKAENNLLR